MAIIANLGQPHCLAARRGRKTQNGNGIVCNCGKLCNFVQYCANNETFHPPPFGTLFARIADVILFPLRKEPALAAALTVIHTALPAISVAVYLATKGGDEWFATSHYPHICMGVALSWLLGTVAALSRQRWVRIVCLIVPLTLLVTQLSLSLLFNQCVNPATVQMLLETTGREAGEFLSDYLPTWQFAGLLAVGAAAVCVVEWLRHPASRLLRGWRLPGWPRVAAAALLTPLLAYGALQEYDHARMAWCDESTFSDLSGRHLFSLLGRTAIPFNSLCYSIGYLRMGRLDCAANADLSRHILRGGPSAFATTGLQGLHIVVVIGETHIKHRSQLYGYALPNEPWLTAEQQRGQLVRFDNAVNCAYNTDSVLLNSLNLNHPTEGEGIGQHAYWPTLFKAAGWHTAIYDYQVDLPENTKCHFGLAEYMFPHALRDSLYDHMEATAIELDPDTFVRPAYGDSASTLSLYHLLGQHNAYRERYPAAYSRFTASDIADGGRPWMTTEKRQIEAEYANATLYNDHVLSQIASTVSSLDAVLVYYGDHGEEIYDYRDAFGRVLASAGQERQWLQCLAEVPLAAWWTPLFAERHPEKVAALRAAAQRPIYTPLIGHAILHLAGIDGWGYSAQRDFLSDDYAAPRRLVNGELDYDHIMQKQGE